MRKLPSEGRPRREDESIPKEIENAIDSASANLGGRIAIVRLSSKEVVILGTIKGLVSEQDLIRKAIKEHCPDVIALHISPEEIKGLEAVVKGDVESTLLSSYEKVYARELSRFGEVQVPPPSLVESFRMASELDIPIRHLDFDEEKYSSVYTKYIGGMTMVRQSLRLKRVNRKKFKSTTVEEFVKEWDEVVNKFKGYRRLEAKREVKMASRIQAISGKFNKVLAVVELERMDGIVDNLRT